MLGIYAGAANTDSKAAFVRTWADSDTGRRFDPHVTPRRPGIAPASTAAVGQNRRYAMGTGFSQRRSRADERDGSLGREHRGHVHRSRKRQGTGDAVRVRGDVGDWSGVVRRASRCHHAVHADNHHTAAQRYAHDQAGRQRASTRDVIHISLAALVHCQQRGDVQGQLASRLRSSYVGGTSVTPGNAPPTPHNGLVSLPRSSDALGRAGRMQDDLERHRHDTTDFRAISQIVTGLVAH